MKKNKNTGSYVENPKNTEKIKKSRMMEKHVHETKTSIVNELHDDNNRISKAEKLLGKQLTDLQKKSILEAHLIGYKGEKKTSYTFGDIKKKVSLLKKAGFSSDDIRKLFVNNVCGVIDINEEVVDVIDVGGNLENKLENKKDKENKDDLRSKGSPLAEKIGLNLHIPKTNENFLILTSNVDLKNFNGNIDKLRHLLNNAEPENLKLFCATWNVKNNPHFLEQDSVRSFLFANNPFQLLSDSITEDLRPEILLVFLENTGCFHKKSDGKNVNNFVFRGKNAWDRFVRIVALIKDQKLGLVDVGYLKDFLHYLLKYGNVMTEDFPEEAIKLAHKVFQSKKINKRLSLSKNDFNGISFSDLKMISRLGFIKECYKGLGFNDEQIRLLKDELDEGFDLLELERKFPNFSQDALLDFYELYQIDNKINDFGDDYFAE